MTSRVPFAIPPTRLTLSISIVRFQPIMTLIVAVALFSLAVLATAGGLWLATLTSAFALALACAGVGLLYGQLGLVSLCQYALVGVGGWTTLRLSHGLDLPFEASLFMGGVAASAVGMIWGLPALRIRGLYLAIVTLMLAGAFQIVISAWGFPDGGSGLLGRADSAARSMLQRPTLARGDAAYFAYVATALVIGLLVIEFHRISKPGRAWALIRKDEQMAAATGVNLVLYKAWAFALAGFLAGVAGGLLAGAFGQLDGRSFSAAESILLFALTIVGGVGNWLGPIIASLLIRAAPIILNEIGANGFFAMTISAVLLLQTLIMAPNGISGQISSATTALVRLARKRDEP